MRTKIALVASIVVGWLSSGCSMETSADGSTARVEEAVSAADFFYFRSNATGWGVDPSTRLTPLGHPLTLARTYLVTEPWMVSDVDTATVTVTNQENGWGTRQEFYDLANTQRFVVSGTQPLVLSPPGGDPHFKVDYARLERHRVVANFRVTPPTLSIDSATDICAQTTCPPGTHCELLPDASQACVPN